VGRHQAVDRKGRSNAGHGIGRASRRGSRRSHRQRALGIKDASPQSIQDAIKTGTLDADHILALKKAEQDFAIQMAAMGYKDAEALAELEFKDRDSARNREIQVKDRTPMILSFVFTAGFFVILGYMLKFGLKKDGGEALLILLGALGAGVQQVLAYYFGSSASSSRKDQLLYNSTPTQGAK